MPYLGRSTDGFGVRDRFVFTASGSETSLSGSDDNSRTLKYQDGTYIDVFMNGVLLLRGTDYNTTTTNTIGGLASLSANDIVEIIVYDVFSIADTVSKTSGGTFSGAISLSSTIGVTGAATLSSTLAVTGAQTLTGTTSATQIDMEGETIFEERAIMLEGTDSDFSNEGSLLLLDASASGTDAGEKLLFEANTLDSLTKEDNDVLVLEDNDNNGFIFYNTTTNERVSTQKITLESGTQFEIPNTLTAPKVTGVAEIANVGGDQNTNFDNSVSVDVKAMSLGAGTHILDLDRNANFQLTLSGNITLANPANLTAGTTGSIFVVQDGTGSRTVSYGSSWDFIGGTAPTMTTAASSVDRIDYIVLDSTNIHAVATLAYS